MNKPVLTAREHYDRLAEAGHGRNDPPVMQSYMARWDGPLFREALGDLTGKDVLEVGIGMGRIARQVLNAGCRTLTGLDISPRTTEVARSDLADFPNLELVLADITAFRREQAFDLAYSVLTFMHVEDKPRALSNIVASLRPGGHVVLSIDQPSDTLSYGDWVVPLSPWLPAQYVSALEQAGCEVADPVPLLDSWTGPDGKRSETYGQCVATLVIGTKE